MEYIATTVLLVIVAALTILHFFTHNSRNGRLINAIPGPSFWPIIGNLWDIISPPNGLWDFFRTSGDRYYPIYKLWIVNTPVVNLRHPDDVEVLLNSQKNITKSDFYKYLHPWLNEGLLTSTGNKWRGRRKTLTPAFHFNVLQEFVGVFIENSQRMVDTLMLENGEVVKDLVPFFAKYTLNAICETAMGTALQDNDVGQVDYRRSVKQMGDFVYHRMVRPWLDREWIFSLTSLGRQHEKALKKLHGFTTTIIKARQQYHEETGGEYLKALSLVDEIAEDPSVANYDLPLRKKRLAMLDLLIAAQRNRQSIDDLGIREEVDTFIFEGHDTTVMAVCFTVLLLAENKEIQETARAEIDAVLKNSDGKLGIKELQSLSYLDRCIKESLRIFPSVPIFSRQIVSDLNLKNFVLPRGTVANLHVFDTHRDPNFWPEPLRFDPDRFLPERIEGRHPFSYIPFSGGPRNCIGQKFAMLELKVFIGLLLHSFRLEAVMQAASVRIVPDLVLKSLDPLHAKFVPIR